MATDLTFAAIFDGPSGDLRIYQFDEDGKLTLKTSYTLVSGGATTSYVCRATWKEGTPYILAYWLLNNTLYYRVFSYSVENNELSLIASASYSSGSSYYTSAPLANFRPGDDGLIFAGTTSSGFTAFEVANGSITPLATYSTANPDVAEGFNWNSLGNRVIFYKDSTYKVYVLKWENNSWSEVLVWTGSSTDRRRFPLFIPGSTTDFVTVRRVNYQLKLSYQRINEAQQNISILGETTPKNPANYTGVFGADLFTYGGQTYLVVVSNIPGLSSTNAQNLNIYAIQGNYTFSWVSDASYFGHKTDSLSGVSWSKTGFGLAPGVGELNLRNDLPSSSSPYILNKPTAPRFRINIINGQRFLQLFPLNFSGDTATGETAWWGFFNPDDPDEFWLTWSGKTYVTSELSELPTWTQIQHYNSTNPGAIFLGRGKDKNYIFNSNGVTTYYTCLWDNSTRSWVYLFDSYFFLSSSHFHVAWVNNPNNHIWFISEGNRLFFWDGNTLTQKSLYAFGVSGIPGNTDNFPIYYTYYSAGARVYKTTDGVNWSFVNLSGYSSLSTISISPSGKIWVSGTASASPYLPRISVSTNGGSSFSTLNLNYSFKELLFAGGTPYVYNIFPLSDDEIVFVVGPTGFVYHYKQSTATTTPIFGGNSLLVYRFNGTAVTPTTYYAPFECRPHSQGFSSALSVFTIQDPPPQINSFSPTEAWNKKEVINFTVSGSNFVEGAEVIFVSGSTEIPATVLTISSTQITGSVNGALFTPGSWGVKVINPDEQFALLEDALLIKKYVSPTTKGKMFTLTNSEVSNPWHP